MHILDFKPYLEQRTIERDNGCIDWTGGVDRDGRAYCAGGPARLFGIFRVPELVMRLEGIDMDKRSKFKHTCGNKLCCNPNHIVIVAAKSAPKSPPASPDVSQGRNVFNLQRIIEMTYEQVLELRKQWVSGRDISSLAAQHNLTEHETRYVIEKRFMELYVPVLLNQSLYNPTPGN